MAGKRKPTSTSNFGVGRRESHDATQFYSRFTLPEVSAEQAVDRLPETALDRIYRGDSRDMKELADSCVALVVTSPPYFAGKEYEEALGEGHIPASYVEYLEMLHDVFAECVRVLEPGGRMAINVANLGRKPYRSLAADVIYILQDRLGLLLRGEIIWQKGYGAAGSCAWGSFQSAANPVLRDITERVVVASKGRFDRAVSRRERKKKKLPSEGTMFKDDFMEATLDVWDIPPESAHRVGHPAPFPVELPQRLIELYTYRDDVVLDPFMGSGSTAVAALRSDRRYVCYEIDDAYADAAEERLRSESAQLAAQRATQREKGKVRRPSLPAVPNPASEDEPFQHRAVREGQRAKEIAYSILKDCGFVGIEADRRFANGVEVNFVARDAAGRKWFFDVSGAFTSSRAGLKRTDTVWKALGKAAVVKQTGAASHPLVLLTTDLPPKQSAGHYALRSVRGKLIHDAVEMMSDEGQARLSAYAAGEGYDEPVGDLQSPAERDDV